ncbi:class I adenylate cyclase [Paraferrimonas haliotis]|uniref:Adenylate cyclase n=1 Tax=Paraferrimonas haliotis TaxID=2013866 RepID=A0AA37TKI8_9GAMM|nr:class I adenylate cyclase [Paraferrimonas haliotis]GLS82243.1 adenylate cyclase [Paraferrimonas haliotis]
MLQVPASDHQFALETAKNVNQLRLQRALALLTSQGAALLEALPALFHFHDPALPGYIEADTPHGIQTYLDPIAYQKLNQLEFSRPLFHRKPQGELIGVYAMGSTGSFGHSHDSDIDLWVIHHPLSNEQQSLLNRKCDLISDFFADFGLELSCFLVAPNQFIEHKGGQLSQDASGSAQHWLLLDEFYRTHICLAGQQIQWWPKEYGDCQQALDLGDLSELPASEYFGAALWQLHKGQARPHKSLLKVLLLEAYSEDYPKGELLSQTLWRQACQGDYSCDNDPYVLLLRRVSNYLKRHYDDSRLELVRQCFYLKSGITLTDNQQNKDWRHDFMASLTNSWGWSAHHIAQLDNVSDWDAAKLTQFNRQLDELLLSSYNRLVKFAGRQQLTHDMSLEDLGLLTRRMHTRFNPDPNKLNTFNRLWSRNQAEAILHIESHSERGFNLFGRNLGVGPRAKPRLLHRAKSALELVAWARLNGVCSDQTQWRHQGDLGLYWLNKVAASLTKDVLAQPKVTLDNLRNPWKYNAFIWVVNPLTDPVKDFKGQSLTINFFGNSIFNIGAMNTNLVGSMGVLARTTWGEWHCYLFDGEQAILEALQFACQSEARECSSYQTLCCSDNLSKKLIDAISILLKNGVSTCLDSPQHDPQEQPLRLGGKDYLLNFSSLGMTYREVDLASTVRQKRGGHSQLLTSKKTTIKQRLLTKLRFPRKGD